jgi:lipopolysaccharide transport system ATP-binding protein
MTATASYPSREVAVRVDGLRKRYRLGQHRSLQQTVKRLLPGPSTRPTFEALAGVDLVCHRGEALGIVGVNGSGKSTLLQILSGATLPTSGEMRVRGRVLPLLAVGQGFHPELTGYENVTLFASALGFRRRMIAERMDAVAAFADLGPHMETPVKRFSTGMISRLSFSVGMMFPADIYIFDEVLAVVDAEFQGRCLAEIKRLHQSGRTVLFVSHNRGQMAQICERIIWLEKGAVRDHGPAFEVLDAYEREHGTVEGRGDRPGRFIGRRRYRAK